MRNQWRLLAINVIVLLCAVLATARPAISDDQTLTSARKTEIIDSVAARLLNEYIYPDRATVMVEAVRDRNAEGDYDKLDSLEQFLEQIQQDLQSVCADQHLHIRKISGLGSPPSLEDEIPADQMAIWNELFRFENYGIHSVSRLDGNVGYIDFRLWPDSALVVDRILAALSLLKGVDALIIDVRYHMGGRTEPAKLVLSHLFEEPVHLVTSINRLRNEEIEEWTSTVSSHGKLPVVPIWVLISNETVSGGELLPFVLKNLGRATVVGTKSGGAGHRTHQVTIPHLGIEMYISHAADVDPSTGIGWEGAGVQPDIEVPASEALTRAHCEALQYLIEIADPILPHMTAEREWALTGLNATLSRKHPSENDLRSYEGEYGTVRIWLEGGSLHTNWPRDLTLVHMVDNWFSFDSGDFYFVRVLFEADDAGQVTALTARYDTGKTERYERTNH